MFQQQRKETEERQQQEALSRVNKDVDILFEANAAETVTFVQFVKLMKDKVIRKEVVEIMSHRMPTLKTNDLSDLNSLLAEADKKMFFAFRDGSMTFN